MWVPSQAGFSFYPEVEILAACPKIFSVEGIEHCKFAPQAMNDAGEIAHRDGKGDVGCFVLNSRAAGGLQ